MAMVSQTLTANGKTDGYQIGPEDTVLILNDDIGGGSAAIDVAEADTDALYEPMLGPDGSALAITVTGAIGLNMLPEGMWVRVNLTSSTSPNLVCKFLRRSDLVTD